MTTATAASPFGTPPPVPHSVPSSLYGTLPQAPSSSSSSSGGAKHTIAKLLPIALAVGGAAAGFFLLGGPLMAVALGVGGLAVGLLGAKLLNK
jgi:hypothetical protein